MTKVPQTERVLQSLRTAGARGVCAADWSGVQGTPDGGTPIPRFAARVMELRQQGHRIDASGGKRHGTKVMVLREQRAPIPAPAEADARLFAPAPASAIHGDEAA